MTRYTSLGYKRTHVEATSLDDAAPAAVDNVTTIDEEEPQKKRRKKSKKLDAPAAPPEPATEDAPAGQEGGEQQEDAGQSDNKPSASSATLRRAQRRKDARAKAISSELRRHRRIDERAESTICFACRQKGHFMRDCPNKAENVEGKKGGKGQDMVGICYRCGSTQHTLSRCRKPAKADNPLPYATCFICSGQGHLASQCPQNKNRGIYPNGGACKICGDNTHLAKDCGLRTNDLQSDALVLGMDRDVGGDEDDFHVLKRRKVETDRDEAAFRRKLAKQSASGKEIGPPTVKKIVKF